MRLGMPYAKSTRKECIYLCSLHSGPINGLAWRILIMGERWVTQTRVARAMRAERCHTCHCEHHMTTAKGSRHAFGMAKARVRSVPTGMCMSTLLRTGAALDMLHFDEREVARSSKRCARSRRCRML